MFILTLRHEHNVSVVRVVLLILVNCWLVGALTLLYFCCCCCFDVVAVAVVSVCVVSVVAVVAVVVWLLVVWNTVMLIVLLCFLTVCYLFWLFPTLVFVQQRQGSNQYKT